MPENDCPRVYIAPLGEGAVAAAQKLVYGLRQKGIYAECDIVGRSLKSQMKYADKTGAEYTVIIGDNEIETGRAILKNMKTSEQGEVEINKLDIILSKEGL